MKLRKLILMSISVLLGTVVVAQSNDQIQNKKGVDMMPVAGEFAVGVGIDFSTFTGFFGDMFNNSTSNNLGSELFRSSGYYGTSIFGKYMLTDNTALRMGLYNYGTDYTTVYDVYDDRSNDPDSLVMDVRRYNFSETVLSLGYEIRRGKTRLRGFYGGDASLLWTGGGSYNYTYGNEMTSSNMAPTTYSGNQTERTLSVNYSSTIGVALRAFVGVEYFVAPKIAVGTEFGWSGVFEGSGKSTTVTETYDPFTNNGEGGVVTNETVTHNGRSFYSGLDNANSQVYLTFYF